jgi:hypothetical protein
MGFRVGEARRRIDKRAAAGRHSDATMRRNCAGGPREAGTGID